MNNITLPQGCMIYTLKNDDVIKATDLFRDLCFDSLNPYKPEDYRGEKWHTVEQDFYGWIGKTLNDYLDFVEEDEHYFEIVRVMK